MVLGMVSKYKYGAILLSMFIFMAFVLYTIVRIPGGIRGSTLSVGNRTFSPHIDPAFNLTLNPNKKIIILLTSFRAGSTFLGSIFDSNPKIQYLFEPFHDGGIRRMYRKGEIVGARPDHTEADLRMLYLQQIMHNCSVFQTNFAEIHERCGTPEENLIRFNSTKCGNKPYKKGEMYQEICKLRPTTVLKVIRLKDVFDLMKIKQIRSGNIKIIHLIRHPFPLMMSRRTGGLFFLWDEKLKIESNYQHYPSWRVKVAFEMFNYCTENTRSHVTAEVNSWLKEKYMLVSHRNMSLKPQETAQKIYNFVGETLSENVKEYITNMTSAKSEGYEAMIGNALEVHKNSSDIVEKWKELGMRGKYWNLLFPVESQCRLLYDLLDEKFNVDSISRAKAFSIQSDVLDRDIFDYISSI